MELVIKMIYKSDISSLKKDMEEKICALIGNEDLAMQFAKKNLAIRKRLDVENVCAEWEKLLR